VDGEYSSCNSHNPVQPLTKLTVVFQHLPALGNVIVDTEEEAVSGQVGQVLQDILDISLKEK
jgi:hypothetical protein